MAVTFAAPVTDCAALVSRVRNGDGAAIEELYGLFAHRFRYFLLHHLGADEIDDKVHDCFITVLQAIHDGSLREPERLMGYVLTVVKRKIVTSINFTMRQRRTRVHLDRVLFSLSDWRENPERGMVSRQQNEIARMGLAGMGSRDREILQRFYVLEQPHEQIRADMGLSYNQFRLLKSRAKARFARLGKRLAAGDADPKKAGGRKMREALPAAPPLIYAPSEVAGSARAAVPDRRRRAGQRLTNERKTRPAWQMYF